MTSTTSTRAATTTTPAKQQESIQVVILQGIKKRLAAIQAHLEFASFSQRAKTTNRHDDDVHKNNQQEEELDDQEQVEEEEEFEYPQFATKLGLGRGALLASILGIVFGIHFAVALQLTTHHVSSWMFSSSSTRQQPDGSDNDNDDFIEDTRRLFYFSIWQWCTYVVTVCTFHFMEFFVTAFYNPTQCSADSFLINHSTSYTAAAIASWMEFWLTRILVVLLMRIVTTTTSKVVTTIPRGIVSSGIRLWIHWSHWSFGLGIVIVVMGQVIRSLAMMTAGESFNHLIQTRRKANHVLITHGVYAVFRHPSYVGFYYWSIGEQCILSNVVNAVVLAIVACAFFQRRIPYEEESLVALFPREYPAYVKRTWMGIPCIPTTHFAETVVATTSTNDTAASAATNGAKED
jgi:protein-S-isoprenylcysteine O-methyltransferase